jgi:uncharacterized protein YjiS (DUF1127 family)
MSLFSQLRAAVQKRVAYNQTVFELRGLTDRIAEDIGLYPADAERLAREAIYN